MKNLKLTGVYNFRDLGGYPTASGGVTRKGQLYRSDGLNQILPDEIDLLIQRGISVDIDLRGETELEKWRDLLGEDSRVRYEWVSLLPSINPKELPKNLADLYLWMLRDGQRGFYRVFSIILENKDQGILFHCSLGKDRTGVVAALLLLLAEVSLEVVIEDYVQSEANLKERIEEMDEKNNPAFKPFLTARKEDIYPFLEALENEYDGAVGYFGAIGFSDEEIKELKQILV